MRVLPKCCAAIALHVFVLPLAAQEDGPTDSVGLGEGAALDLHAAGALPFRDDADAASDISGAITEARRGDRIVFIEFGANWCPDCRALHKLLESSEVAPYLEEHFVLVMVDVGYFDKNLDIVEQVGGDISRGIPSAVFLSSNLEPIGVTRNGELEPARTFGTTQIMRFLQSVNEELKVVSP